MAISLADIIACCCMLTITTTIKEAYTNYSKGDKTMVPQLKTLFDVLGVIQRDSVWWVHSILPKFLRPQPMDYKLWFVYFYVYNKFIARFQKVFVRFYF